MKYPHNTTLFKQDVVINFTEKIKVLPGREPDFQIPEQIALWFMESGIIVCTNNFAQTIENAKIRIYGKSDYFPVLRKMFCAYTNIHPVFRACEIGKLHLINRKHNTYCQATAIEIIMKKINYGQRVIQSIRKAEESGLVVGEGAEQQQLRKRLSVDGLFIQNGIICVASYNHAKNWLNYRPFLVVSDYKNFRKKTNNLVTEGGGANEKWLKFYVNYIPLIDSLLQLK